MAKIDISSKTASAFRRMFDKEIERKGISIKELASVSGVSQRTLEAISPPGDPTVAPKKTPRYDAVVRIALALGQEPREWLKEAGREATELDIQKIKRQFQSRSGAVTASSGETDSTQKSAMQYFDELLQEIRERKTPALMCVTVTSKPAPINTPILREKIAELLDTDLFYIALICPYPCGPTVFSALNGRKNKLLLFYDQILLWIRSMHATLTSRSHSHDRKIRIFVPNLTLIKLPGINSGGGSGLKHGPLSLPLVAPVMRLGEYRPCLVKFNAGHGEQKERFELGCYAGRDQKWLIIFPTQGIPEEQAQAQEICDTWQDYLGDVLEAWQPDKEEPYDKKKLVDWMPWDPGGGPPAG